MTVVKVSYYLNEPRDSFIFGPLGGTNYAQTKSNINFFGYFYFKAADSFISIYLNFSQDG